jgi:hypothetical protein
MNYGTSAETHGFAELARQSAFDFPEAMLPCPLCADSLHAEQLDRHITKVHLLPPDKTIDQRSESFTLTGADRNLRATAIAFPFVFIPTMVLLGLLGVFPNKLVPHALTVQTCEPEHWFSPPSPEARVRPLGSPGIRKLMSFLAALVRGIHGHSGANAEACQIRLRVVKGRMRVHPAASKYG